MFFIEVKSDRKCDQARDEMGKDASVQIIRDGEDVRKR